MVDVVSQVSFECLVTSFGLSIGLWVEGCGQLVFDSHGCDQFFSVVGCEELVFVSNEDSWYPMIAHKSVKHQAT